MENSNQKNNPAYSRTDSSKLVLKDEDWKKVLSPEVYYIARQKGTERPFTSPFETLKDLVNSPNNSFVIAPYDQKLIPMLNFNQEKNK